MPRRPAFHADLLHLNARTVKCPTCKRPAEYSAANPDRPFCSERCRLIDLGEWFAEKHAIPADAPPDHDPESESGSGPN